MNRRSVFAMLLIGLMLSGVVFITVQPIKADSSIITVPDDYSSIQQAIDNAVAGDVIHVKCGFCYENITVNKRLSLIGMNGTQMPEIDGGGAPVVVKIVADGVVLTGFNVTNGFWGDSYGDGHLGGGIQIFGASQCVIANNTVCNNRACGISLVNANNNIVANNTCVKNEMGISLWSWSPQTTSNNLIDNNTCSRNLKCGIAAWSYTFRTWTTNYNNFTNNLLSENVVQPYYGYGIHIGKSNGDILSGNTIFSNYYGLAIDSSSNCTIFHNDFLNNNEQVYIHDAAGGESANQLDYGYPLGGNYYSDYTGVDLKSGPEQNLAGSDGIGDTPLIFNSANQDRYPLMAQLGTFEPEYVQVDFTYSFRDSDGTLLYTKPSTFQLILPNGTVSPPLETGTHLLQAGTTQIMSVIWEGTEVVPNTASVFDTINGAPIINCDVFSLTISPVFYNIADTQNTTGSSQTAINSETVDVTPTSWSIRFPNQTVTTVSSAVTYAQTQIGGYELFGVVLDGLNITAPTGGVYLTADTVWSPQIGIYRPSSNQTFAFNSNSTVTEPNFDANRNQLRFNVAGPSGTDGYTNIALAGDLTVNPEDMVVRQDGTPINYALTQMGDNWLLGINYTHSTHNFEIDFDAAPETLSFVGFDYFFKFNSVRVIYPSEQTPKPRGCSSAMVSDWLSSAFISTKLENTEEGTDTNSAFVNQISGKPLGAANTGLISFGGPLVNPVIAYAENDVTPSSDRAPIKFYADAGTFYFQHSNGASITGASLPASVINNNQDMFVIELYRDGDGRYIMLCYGFGWQGTYAAGKYFDTEIYPNLTAYPYTWIIVKWTDSNANGFVNKPADGDTYTIIAAG